ncbi:MAG: hypothetical protein ABIE47_08120 [Pseudomonadota bacterium]
MRNNSPGETNEDYNFARCRYCGFPLDRSRDRTVKTQQISLTAPVGASDPAAPYEITVKAGCAFCSCPQPYDSKRS